ncbi:CdaR family protein [Heyndrickxia ginsengihumi]|uniref:YbbR-like domain-containing protein n=1 Tax=Heyndrickxia ginsengihumi TaxID=363870 RepID=A0A6M0PBD8_9BACI|nr:CdaR family protein [Heyndrickxia ginsengihumi]MBE6185587.1 YbbR-like domain-containing protein [Bacillus sp. (in: firmicutes)]MCM3022748.1 CdaR family protein [Heyndrickxia ginsengihumi]NEY21715.1 YbbR-like domain-containing protein [Heyndrickxia ginsengihumi]
MDRLMDSRWFMRILALVFAVSLYMSVTVENGGKVINITQNKGSGVVKDVPIELYYDSTNLVVSGAPKTVNVEISGPKILVQQVKASRDFNVYMDLSNAHIGRQKAEIKIKNISDKLKVKLSRKYAYVTVQEKISKRFNVEAEFDKGLVPEGYETSSPIVDPATVKITGAKDVLDKISYVKATLETSKPINSTVSQQAKVRVLDKNLNKLDVVVEPSTVEVTVPVSNPSKQIPITVNPIGSENQGVTIKSITTEPKKVTLYGTSDVLAGIDKLPVNVDISKVKKDTTIKVPIKLPDGVNKATPDTVKAKITVEKNMDEKKISNVPIYEKGLGNDYDVKFLSPESGTIDIFADGTTEELNNISASDFRVSVNLSGMSNGVHEVSYTVSGPKGVSWKLPDDKAKVSIKEKSVTTTTNDDESSQSKESTTDDSSDQNADMNSADTENKTEN